MRSPRFLFALALLALPIAGCTTAHEGAVAACEGLVDHRVGAELVHDEGALVEGDGPFVVRSAYVQPGTGQRVRYVCTAELVRLGGKPGWRLLNLQTDLGLSYRPVT